MKFFSHEFTILLHVCNITSTRLGKISAQPHTIVKQICSQWQCIVFVTVFSLQELNVGWGCAEILPRAVRAVMKDLS